MKVGKSLESGRTGLDTKGSRCFGEKQGARSQEWESEWGGGEGVSYFSGVKNPELPAFDEKHFLPLVCRFRCCRLVWATRPLPAQGWLGGGGGCVTHVLLPSPTGLRAVWAGPSPAGAEVQHSRLSAGAKARHRAMPRVRGAAGYPRRVLSMPGLMCRGRRGGRFGLLMWSSFGDVIANCFKPRRSLLYSEAEWGPLEGFQWASSRRPVEASPYPGQGGGEESQRRLPQSSTQGRGWEELLESDRL